MRAAADFLQGWSKTADMFRHVELAEHMGGSGEEVLKIGMEAFDAFRRALALYEENINLAKKYGVVQDVNENALAVKISAREIGVHEETFGAVRDALAEGGVVGVFEQMHENTSSVLASLANLMERVSETGWPDTRRGPTLGPAADFAPIMMNITEAALACHVGARFFDRAVAE